MFLGGLCGSGTGKNYKRMDRFIKAILSIIALALVAISVRLWMPGAATLGELERADKISNLEARQRALERWVDRVPVVRMQEHQNMKVEVMGTVDIQESPESRLRRSSLLRCLRYLFGLKWSDEMWAKNRTPD